MKYFKLLIFCFILFLVPNVFAQDFTVSNSNITSPNSSGTGKYTGLEIYNSGTSNVYNIGTRYNGQLSRIIFNLSAGGYADANGFEQGHTYTLTMNMATDDWRNKFGSVSVKCEGSSGQELSNGRVTYVSYRKIKFSFTAPTNSWCQFVYVDLKSSNIVSTAFTGVTNWNLSSMVISDPAYDSSGSGSGGGSGSGSTTDPNQSIIDSNNQNTSDIINNNNNNTNDIIDNANQNTQSIIDNQNKNTESTNKLLGSCHKNLFNFNFYSNGNEYMTKDNSIHGFKIRADRYGVDSGITLHDFCPSCQSGKTYYLGGVSTSSNAKYIYLSSIWTYNSSRTLSDTDLSSSVLFYGIYPGGTGSSSDYVDISNIYIVEGSVPSVYGPYNEQICTSKLDDTNQAINDSTNSIINNQNSNLNKQIESEQVCKSYSFTNVTQRDKFLDNAGRLVNGANAGVTDYIDIHSSTITKIKSSGVTWIYSCFYTDSKSLISCITSNNLNSNDQVPSNAYYVRFTMHSNDTPNWKICTNGNQAMNDTLTDTNIDSNLGSGFFDDFENNDFGFSDIVKIPLNTINQLTSTSCSPISIPIPFTSGSVSLPCMTQIYEDNIPTIYNIWKVVSFGIIAYFIVIDLFHIVKGFKDPESDKVEVLDL